MPAGGASPGVAFGPLQQISNGLLTRPGLHSLDAGMAVQRISSPRRTSRLLPTTQTRISPSMYARLPIRRRGSL